MVEVPGWDDEVRPALQALVGHVGDHLEYMTTAIDYSQVRQLAAAYLARVRRLIIAMDVLYDADMPDVLGVPFRVCFEAWVTGMWVILAGQDAVDAVMADHQWRTDKFITDAGLNLPLFDDDESGQMLNAFDRTHAVERLLMEEGDGAEGDLRWSYRLVFAGESGTSVHAGLASVVGHLVDHRTLTGIRPDRQEAGDGSSKLLWTGPLLVMLARRVFEAFHLSTDTLEELGEPIRKLVVRLNEEAAAGEAAAT